MALGPAGIGEPPYFRHSKKKGEAYLSPLATLSFPDLKKVPIYS